MPKVKSKPSKKLIDLVNEYGSDILSTDNTVKLLVSASGSHRSFSDAEYAWLLQNKQAMLETNARSGDIPESVILLEPREVPSNVVPSPPKEFQKRTEEETVTHPPDGDFTDAEYKWLLQNKKLMIEDQVRDGMDIPDSILIRPRRNISEDVIPVPPARYQQRAK